MSCRTCKFASYFVTFRKIAGHINKCRIATTSMTSIEVVLFIWFSCIEHLYRLKIFPCWAVRQLTEQAFIMQSYIQCTWYQWYYPPTLSFIWLLMYFTFHIICLRPYLFVWYPLTSFCNQCNQKMELYQVKFISWHTDPSLVWQKCFLVFCGHDDLSFILGLASLPSVTVPQYIIVAIFPSCVLCMYSCCTLWGEKTNIWTCVGCMIFHVGLAAPLCWILYGQLFLSPTVSWSCSLVQNIPKHYTYYISKSVFVL